jgi:DNA-binding transcriptional MerR regulator
MSERAVPARTGMFRIGTVANLTGLDVHTIRAWERRHGAVKPARSEGGSRLYDEGAVERLQLLKALVDCGEPIRTVAALSDDALRERLAALLGLSGSPGVSARGSEIEIAAIAPTTQQQLRASGSGLAGYRVVAAADELDDALLAALEQGRPDILLVELERLGDDPLPAVTRLQSAARAPILVVLYAFAPRRLLARLARTGARLLRGPLRIEQLRQVLDDAVLAENARRGERRSIAAPPTTGGSTSARRTAPRYDDAQLARLVEASSSIRCECPNHLATLIKSLLAFEDYSRTCATRDADDAALHLRLAEGTAEARERIEDLLEMLCEVEGLAV